MTVEYQMWDGNSIEMIEFEPQYFKEHVSTDVKDKAKDKGLVFYDTRDGKIVLTDEPNKYQDLLDAFGLESYLEKRIKNMI